MNRVMNGEVQKMTSRFVLIAFLLVLFTEQIDGVKNIRHKYVDDDDSLDISYTEISTSETNYSMEDDDAPNTPAKKRLRGDNITNINEVFEKEGGPGIHMNSSQTDIIEVIEDDEFMDFIDEGGLGGDNITYFKGLLDMKYKFEYDQSPSFSDEMVLRGEIGTYFEDVSEIENICESFFNDFGVDICEMEGGWRKRNKNGRLLKPLPPPKEISITTFRGTDLTNKTTVATICPVHNHYYYKYEYRADKFFKKKIRFLVADPDFDWEDLNIATKALDYFNYCTENMVDFKFDKHYIPVNVSNMDWMQATYDVMLEAESMGIGFERTVTSEGDKPRFKFNTGKHMTMIILPDNVRFKGRYGFATLHYGLSVLKSSSTKNSKFVLHEIGHNLGMKHSSSPSGGKYGDDRCLMGAAKKKRTCFNGPKSYYLGLYMDYTAIVKKETSCYSVVTLADLRKHLRQRKKLKRRHGQYYVILVVKIPYDDMVETVYMMYYAGADIITITTGKTGVIENTDGQRLLYSDISQRVFDLKANGSIVYGNVLIKRCPSIGAGVGKVLVSFDPSVPHQCENIVTEY